MGDEKVIQSLSQQLCKTSERIGSFAIGIEDLKRLDRDLADTYSQMLMDEVGHVQVLALELTRLVADDEDPGSVKTTVPLPVKTAEGDDGAFMPGELESVEGEKPEEKPEA